MGGSNGFSLPGRPRRMLLSLAPLIDVTFILLIFFMLVAQFTRLVPVDVQLGQISQTAPPADPGAGAPPASHLILHADGTMELDGEGIGTIGRLAQALHLRSEAVRASASPGQPLLLNVEPDGDVDLQILIDALSALQGTPDFTVRLAVPQERVPRP